MKKRIIRIMMLIVLVGIVALSIKPDTNALEKTDLKTNERNVIAELQSDGFDIDYYKDNGYKVSVVDYNDKIGTFNGNLKLEKGDSTIILDFYKDKMYKNGNVVLNNLNESIVTENIYNLIK